MAKQNLNRGTTANDGTGDSLRVAAQKINENFTELYAKFGGDSLSATVTLTAEGVVFEGSSADSNETTLHAINPTQDNFVYIADDSGTLVLDSCAQTLTNKTILEPTLTTPKIKDVDSSHTYNIQVGGLSANTNLNIPSLSDSDTFVLANTTQTLTNKTIDGLSFNNAKIGGINLGSVFFDSASNEAFTFTRVASAVNHIDFKNNSTTNSPRISAVGDDTNVSLELASKGTETIHLVTATSVEKGTDITGNTAIQLTQPHTVFNSGSQIVPTLADGTETGTLLFLSNVNSGQARVTPSGASSNIQGVSTGSGYIQIDQGEGCILVWNTGEGKWFMVGNNGTTFVN